MQQKLTSISITAKETSASLQLVLGGWSNFSFIFFLPSGSKKIRKHTIFLVQYYQKDFNQLPD